MKEIIESLENVKKRIKKHTADLKRLAIAKVSLEKLLSGTPDETEKIENPNKSKKRRKRKDKNNPETTEPMITLRSPKKYSRAKARSPYLYGNLAAEKLMALRANGFVYVKIALTRERDGFSKKIVRWIITLSPTKVKYCNSNEIVRKINFKRKGGGFTISCRKFIKKHRLDMRTKQNRFLVQEQAMGINCFFIIKNEIGSVA